ncbi:MAG: hypothetical protein ABIH67_03275 [Candidatus Uhrbacteria bacterium]
MSKTEQLCIRASTETAYRFRELSRIQGVKFGPLLAKMVELYCKQPEVQGASKTTIAVPVSRALLALSALRGEKPQETLDALLKPLIIAELKKAVSNADD